MATFLHRTTKQLAPDDGTGDLGPSYIRNPDLSAVALEPVKYWVIAGDTAGADRIGAADAPEADWRSGTRLGSRLG